LHDAADIEFRAGEGLQATRQPTEVAVLVTASRARVPGFIQAGVVVIGEVDLCRRALGSRGGMRRITGAGGGGTLAIRVRCPVIRRDDCQERSVFGKELWGRKIASLARYGDHRSHPAGFRKRFRQRTRLTAESAGGTHHGHDVPDFFTLACFPLAHGSFEPPLKADGMGWFELVGIGGGEFGVGRTLRVELSSAPGHRAGKDIDVLKVLGHEIGQPLRIIFVFLTMGLNGRIDAAEVGHAGLLFYERGGGVRWRVGWGWARSGGVAEQGRRSQGQDHAGAGEEKRAQQVGSRWAWNHLAKK